MDFWATYWTRHDDLIASVGGGPGAAAGSAASISADATVGPDAKRRRVCLDVKTDESPSILLPAVPKTTTSPPQAATAVHGDAPQYRHRSGAAGHTEAQPGLERPGTPPPLDPHPAVGGGGGAAADTHATASQTPPPRRQHSSRSSRSRRGAVPIYRHRYASTPSGWSAVGDTRDDSSATALVDADVLIVFASAWANQMPGAGGRDGGVDGGALLEASIVAVDVATAVVLHTSEITTRQMPCQLGTVGPTGGSSFSCLFRLISINLRFETETRRNCQY